MISIRNYDSEYHLRTKFDHSNRQNIHFQSQNRCFKKLTVFRRKLLPQSVRLLEGGGGIEKLFGRIPFEQQFSCAGASLTLVIEGSILELNSSGDKQGFIHLARRGVGEDIPACTIVALTPLKVHFRQ